MNPGAFGKTGLKVSTLLEAVAGAAGTSMGRGSGEGREAGSAVCWTTLSAAAPFEDEFPIASGASTGRSWGVDATGCACGRAARFR
jgi:hypothetical protein